MIIEPLIGVWLLLGATFDYKFYNVPSFISFSIIILSIPLLILNHVWAQPLYILGFKLFVILYFVATWRVKRFGIADLKVITPIVLMLPEMIFLLFISLMLVIGIVFGVYLLITKHQREMPLFVPIAAAYWIAILL